MYSDLLTPLECNLLDLFFLAIPSWKATILSQLKLSVVSRSDCFSSYFINFDVPRNTGKIYTDVQVPIEIIVGDVEVPQNKVIGSINNCKIISPCSLTIPSCSACGIRIHFIDGRLSEIEAYRLDGNKIDLTQILKGRLTYIVYDNTIIRGNIIWT